MNPSTGSPSSPRAHLQELGDRRRPINISSSRSQAPSIISSCTTSAGALLHPWRLAESELHLKTALASRGLRAGPPLLGNWRSCCAGRPAIDVLRPFFAQDLRRAAHRLPLGHRLLGQEGTQNSITSFEAPRPQSDDEYSRLALEQLASTAPAGDPKRAPRPLPVRTGALRGEKHARAGAPRVRRAVKLDPASREPRRVRQHLPAPRLSHEILNELRILKDLGLAGPRINDDIATTRRRDRPRVGKWGIDQHDLDERPSPSRCSPYPPSSLIHPPRYGHRPHLPEYLDGYGKLRVRDSDPRRRASTRLRAARTARRYYFILSHLQDGERTFGARARLYWPRRRAHGRPVGPSAPARRVRDALLKLGSGSTTSSGPARSSRRNSTAASSTWELPGRQGEGQARHRQGRQARPESGKLGYRFLGTTRRGLPTLDGMTKPYRGKPGEEESFLRLHLTGTRRSSCRR